MKNNIKLMCAASAMLMMASCTDLDVPVESQYTEYPSSEIAQEAKLSDIYYHLRGVMGRRYMEAMALSSDEWVGYSFGSDNYYDAGTYQHATLHCFKPEDATIGWYEDVTAGITKANEAITSMGATSPGAAAARAMRAYFHWVLVDGWGDTPILERQLEEGEEIERKPRAEVAQWIANELEEIIPQLTTDVTENTYGKPTRWMAEALLAKLYINWGVYTAKEAKDYEAATYQNPKLNRVVELCEDIIQSGKFDLTAGAAGHKCKNTYRAKFTPDNGAQIKDFIYAMPYTAANKDGMQYGRPRTWKKGNSGSYYGTTLSKSVGGNFAMTPEASNRFTLSGDLRNEMILGGTTLHVFDPATYAITDEVYKYQDEPVQLTKTIHIVEPEYLAVANDLTGYCQGYRSVKWFVVDEDFKNDRCQSNDVPIFRLADIYLLEAEAIVRGAKTSHHTAQELFNAIRSYNQAPTLQGTPTLQDILDERGRELFDENWRRNDMIRFGTFESEYGVHVKDMKYASFDPQHRIFPIPESVLNKNPKWKQNPGY